MKTWIIWLIVATTLLVVEVATQTMWGICLAAGCILSMFAALAGLSLEWQIAALVVATVLTCMLMKPVIMRFRSSSRHKTATGMDALLGRRAIVTHEIKPGQTGRARIDGDSWQVRAPGVEDTIDRGSEVVVTGYDSIILDVAKE